MINHRIGCCKPLKKFSQQIPSLCRLRQMRSYATGDNVSIGPSRIEFSAKRSSNDNFKFEFAFSCYAYHSPSEIPMISSLADLSGGGNVAALMPLRRAPGSPLDTLSVRSGDDAMICSSSLLGVADGVSDWKENADAGLWARSLLETMSRGLARHKVESSPYSPTLKDVQEILDSSFFHTSDLMDVEGLSGSSTALICTILGSQLAVISIGDSKVFVIRDGDVVETNEIQMLSALCPQQLGTNNINVIPSQIAWYDSFELEEDDIIVMSSDGLTDNLWPDEILVYVDKTIFREKKSLKELANLLVYKAKTVAYDNFAVSPYVEIVNKLPSKSSGAGFIMGGKTDDISVCVARVVKND
ncbi:unnamed protein product [Kuraishia capsulata CBS 1993]|uniref:Protein phosphatase n=1 Tax=Kuraishia capsulata CBS 1993 TaxID=1382522 RepID=W6MKT9_9ASCO|nr:uncharacterized protein KUCA_T00001351001 [Kuraishia capsulata CBS 1993]CDK25382.1 unnamed protein product [Kuraishia capsulata CBS 1993]